jgi:hypothetical protein
MNESFHRHTVCVRRQSFWDRLRLKIKRASGSSGL